MIKTTRTTLQMCFCKQPGPSSRLKKEFYSDILRAGFEPTILVFESKKTFHALECAARVRFWTLMIEHPSVALHHLGF